MTPCPMCQAALDEVSVAGGGEVLVACTTCFNPALVEWLDGSIVARPLPGAMDVRLSAPAGSIGVNLLAQTAAEAQELPVLPGISQRILRQLSDPEFTLADLVATIREDSVIAIAVMKQANSAAFGGLHEIKDLNAACARLGMRTIANTVQLVANRKLFVTGNSSLKQSMERLWRHSVATAHCANEIARLTLAPNQESVFLAGLIHDVGKVLLLEMVANPRNATVRGLRDNPELFREFVERLHPIFGLLVAQAWNLPSAFRAAVYFHHSPGDCPVKEWLHIVHTTALGNMIAQMEGYGMYESTPEVFLASNPSSVFLGLSDMKLATLRVDLSDTLEALFEAAG